MRKTKCFFTKVAALIFLLFSFLVLDAAILGVLPIVGAIFLMPACLLLTARLFSLSLRPQKRRAVQKTTPAPPGNARAHRNIHIYRRAKRHAPHHPHAA